MTPLFTDFLWMGLVAVTVLVVLGSILFFLYDSIMTVIEGRV